MNLRHTLIAIAVLALIGTGFTSVALAGELPGSEHTQPFLALGLLALLGSLLTSAPGRRRIVLAQRVLRDTTADESGPVSTPWAPSRPVRAHSGAADIGPLAIRQPGHNVRY